MAYWTTRTYTCKKCKKLVTITPKDRYICNGCSTPLVSSTQPYYYIGMNPMARQTKMEFSEQSFEESVKEFQGNR